MSQERLSNLVSISIKNKILEQASIKITTESFVFMKIVLWLKLSYDKLLYPKDFLFLMVVTKTLILYSFVVNDFMYVIYINSTYVFALLLLRST